MNTKKETENREGFIFGLGYVDLATHNISNNKSNNLSNNHSNNQSNSNNNQIYSKRTEEVNKEVVNNRVGPFICYTSPPLDNNNLNTNPNTNPDNNSNNTNKILNVSENVIKIIKPIFCPLCNQEIMKDDELHNCSNNMTKEVKSVSNGLNMAKMGYSVREIEKENIEYEQEITDSNISNILNYIPRSQKIKKEVQKWII